MHLILIFSQLYRFIRIIDHEIDGMWLIFHVSVYFLALTRLYINKIQMSRFSFDVGSSLPTSLILSQLWRTLTSPKSVAYRSACWQRTLADLRVRNQLLRFLGLIVVLGVTAFGWIELHVYCSFHMPVPKLIFDTGPNSSDCYYFSLVLVNSYAPWVEPQVPSVAQETVE